MGCLKNWLSDIPANDEMSMDRIERCILNILLNRLLAVINEREASTIEYYIAYTFLQNLFKISGFTIEQTARLCNVSKSTISKFVREIGFDDYMDFKLSAMSAQDGVVYGWGENIIDFIGHNGIDRYIDILKADMDYMKTSIDMENIDILVEDLIHYHKVAAFGIVHSQTAALDLQFKLAFHNKIIYTNLSDISQDEYILHADEDTLIIIFSNSGKYITEYQLKEGYPRKDIFDLTKGRIVLITSNRKLAGDSRVDLCIGFDYTSHVQNHPYYFQFITDLIAVKYKQRMEENS